MGLDVLVHELTIRGLRDEDMSKNEIEIRSKLTVIPSKLSRQLDQN